LLHKLDIIIHVPNIKNCRSFLIPASHTLQRLTDC